MTDFKSAAEQQVRETLGWRTYCPTAPHEVRVFNLAVSKTAELMEMTSQRDEAQKALEIAKGSKSQAEAFSGMQSNYLTLKKFADNQAIARADAERRAESAEATLREQAERIKELEIPKPLLAQYDNAVDKAHSVGAFKMLHKAEAAIGKWLVEKQLSRGKQ